MFCVRRDFVQRTHHAALCQLYRVRLCSCFTVCRWCLLDSGLGYNIAKILMATAVQQSILHVNSTYKENVSITSHALEGASVCQLLSLHQLANRCMHQPFACLKKLVNIVRYVWDTVLHTINHGQSQYIWAYICITWYLFAGICCISILALVASNQLVVSL